MSDSATQEAATVHYPDYWQEACAHLAQKDATMARLIAEYEGEGLFSNKNAFVTLIRAIIGQQVSVKSADSCWQKLLVACGDEVTPDQLDTMTEEGFRACGFSRQKIAYSRNVATHFLAHDIHNADYWHPKSDEEIIEELSSIKGIGVWTAEMFLIFYLLRPNVWPLGDIGVLKAVDILYPRRLPTPDDGSKPKSWKSYTPKQRTEIYTKVGKKFAPYRTVAAWYLWRSLDPVQVAY